MVKPMVFCGNIVNDDQFISIMFTIAFKPNENERPNCNDCKKRGNEARAPEIAAFADSSVKLSIPITFRLETTDVVIPHHTTTM
jgi:hypothetical protein